MALNDGSLECGMDAGKTKNNAKACRIMESHMYRGLRLRDGLRPRPLLESALRSFAIGVSYHFCWVSSSPKKVRDWILVLPLLICFASYFLFFLEKARRTKREGKK